MEYGIFQKRLQQQMRRFRIVGRMVLPHNLYAHMPHADLLDGNIFLRPFDFLPQGTVLTAVAQLCAEQVGQIFQQSFRIIFGSRCRR